MGRCYSVHRLFLGIVWCKSIHNRTAVRRTTPKNSSYLVVPQLTRHPPSSVRYLKNRFVRSSRPSFTAKLRHFHFTAICWKGLLLPLIELSDRAVSTPVRSHISAVQREYTVPDSPPDLCFVEHPQPGGQIHDPRICRNWIRKQKGRSRVGNYPGHSFWTHPSQNISGGLFRRRSLGAV